MPVISGSTAGSAIPWWPLLGLTLVQYYIWGVLSVPIIRLTQKYLIEFKHWTWSLLIHVLGWIFFSAVWTALFLAFVRLTGAPFIDNKHQPFLTVFWLFYTARLPGQSLFTYIPIILAAHMADYQRKYQTERLIAAELKASLAQAQLQVLRGQLNPHFLFNTLTAISALVYDAPKLADKTIVKLSEMLRISLNSSKTQEVSLKEELDLLLIYVEIEQILLGDRLEVQWSIASETYDAAIPNMLLQPLVENSIRHGIAPLETGGRIEITAWRELNMLRLSVRDNGNGLASGEKENSGGVGLANIRARLLHLYGREHKLEISSPPSGGALVNLTIPFREVLWIDNEDAHSDS